MLLFVIVAVATSCKKPKDGVDGKDGVSATVEVCRECHNATTVELAATQFELSKHYTGLAAEEEAGNTSCAPCHESEGFKYACANHTPATFTLNSTTGVWANNYVGTAGASYGVITCNTCHSNIHNTYTTSDLPSLTTVDAVPLTMWGGAKTVNLTQGGGSSNLCVKCHQPRPLTCNTQTTARLLNYDSLRTSPLVVFYDSTAGAVNKYVKPSYRMHTHYGAVGAVYAGVGGIEFSGNTGDLAYENSAHTTVATCQDCHMAPITGVAGGHSFKAKGNFNGCNVSGCHASSPITSSSAKWTTTRSDVKALLEALATKINACGGGHDILHRESDATLNLWADVTTNDYDGYLDIYSSSTNPAG